MDEVVRSLRRGGEIMLAAAWPLLAAGAAWLVLCELTGWLLVGPALYGLFAIALAAHEGRRPSPWDMFAALDDVAGPLVAGFVFWLPFALWGAIDAAAGSVPAVLTLAVAVHFALFVNVFPVLVDQGRGPFEAFSVAARLAQRDGRPSPGRVSGLARQLLFGTAALVVLWACWQLSPLGFPVLVIGAGPFVVCVLAASYAQRVSPAEDEVGAPSARPAAARAFPPAATPEHRASPEPGAAAADASAGGPAVAADHEPPAPAEKRRRRGTGASPARGRPAKARQGDEARAAWDEGEG